MRDRARRPAPPALSACAPWCSSTTAVPYRAELRGRASARARPVAARAIAGRPPPSTIAPAAPARRPRSLGPTTVVAANAAAGWPGPSAAHGTAPTAVGGAAGLDRRPPTVRPRPGALVMPVLAGGAGAQCEASSAEVQRAQQVDRSTRWPLGESSRRACGLNRRRPRGGSGRHVDPSGGLRLRGARGPPYTPPPRWARTSRGSTRLGNAAPASGHLCRR